MRLTARTLVAWLTIPLLAAAGLAAQNRDLRLVEAVKSRNGEAARGLLKQQIDVNVAQPDGATALHWAAHWDDLDLADLLIHAGAQLNAANSYGVTPVLLAAENGSAAMVEKLLAAGGNANAALPNGETLLMTASRTGNVASVRSLLARGAEVNATEISELQTALMWAVSEKHLDVARTLIENSADVHARTRSRFTPLMFAAREGPLDIVRMLLEKGARIHDAAADGSTPLVIATVRGHVDIATFLLDQGADPNVDSTGYTPLHWAAGTWEGQLNGPRGVVPQPDSEWSAIGGLTGQEKVDMINTLLAHGANPNARLARRPPNMGQGGFGMNLVGATPFFVAAATADVPTMQRLLERGADPLLGMNDNTNALMVASGLGRSNADSRVTDDQSLEAAQFLVSLGANINAANAAGETALHATSYRGNDKVAQFLLDKGHAINPKNKNGRTPLDVAEGEYFQATFQIHQSTADILRKRGGTSSPRVRQDLAVEVK